MLHQHKEPWYESLAYFIGAGVEKMQKELGIKELVWADWLLMREILETYGVKTGFIVQGRALEDLKRFENIKAIVALKQENGVEHCFVYDKGRFFKIEEQAQEQSPFSLNNICDVEYLTVL